MTTVTVHTGQRCFDSVASRSHKRAAEIVQATLMRAHIDKGDFTINPKDKQRWKSGKNDTMCLRPGQGREIRIRVKCTGNDSVWDYALMPVNGSVDFDFVRQMLEAYLGPEFVEDGGESLNSEPGDSPLPVPDFMKQEEPVAETIKPVITAPPPVSDTSASNPLAALDKLRAALTRREDRIKQIAALREQIVEADKQIQKLQEKKEQQELAIFEMEDANLNDKEIQLADQFAVLLSQFK